MKDLYWMEEATEQKPPSGDENDENIDSENSVTSYSHNIYFYSEVDRPRVLSLNKKIVQVGVKLRNFSNGNSRAINNLVLGVRFY